MYGYKYNMFLINPYIYGASAASYLVDDYSPVLAFSLRKLSSTATVAIRVRRTSDSAEQDIGFSGNDLDTASLESFCSATNGYVVKWYNQGTGGATYDATQSTTTAQPAIVSSGTTITSPGNGLPTLSHDLAGPQYFIMAAAHNFNQNLTDIAVFNRVSAKQQMGFGLSSDFKVGGLIWWSNNYIRKNNYDAANPTDMDLNTNTGDHIYFAYRDATNVNYYLNNVAGTSYASSATGQTFDWIFRQGGYATSQGCYHQEMIYFDSNESANRTAIQDEINAYYSIY